MEAGKFIAAYGRIKMSGIAGNIEEQNNVLIKKSDYEKYRIILPYRFLFGKRRQNYLSAELEKLHPCFSDEFCFDPDFIGLTRKGLSADVMVMHKYKLAEYENRHPLTGSGFLAENCDRHRYFVDRKYKVLVLILSLLLVFLGVGLVSWVIRAGEKEKMNISQEREVASKEGNSVLGEKETPVFEESNLLASDFFEAIKASGGSIASIYFHTDGFSESLEASVEGVYPEKLGGLYEKNLAGGNTLQTVYEKGSPSLNLSVQRKVTGSNPVSVVTGASERVDLCREVRTALAECNAVLKRESFIPYKIIFTTVEAEKLFTGLAEIFNQHKKSVSSVKLDEQNGALEAEICVEESAYFGCGIDLKLIAENASLFIKGKKNSEIHTARAAVKKSQMDAGYKKIGEIKNPDGKIISFYKSSEGKIKRIQEEK